jgi:hydrogenase nickel incorporation protein HypA/HybF
MHELSIAEGVVDVAVRHARGRPVTAVELKVGHLRQVVPSALAFAFELVSEGTVLEGAELRMEEVPAAGRCRSCGMDTPLPELPLRCRGCGGWDVEVTRGEELLVESLELEEEGSNRSAAGDARGLRTTLASGG